MSEKKERGKRAAAVSTATGGTAGGVAAVSGVVVGAAEGTAGAAALTSGLATVGSIAGGGMFAGICIVAAAPIIGGALGYGAYRLYKKLATPKQPKDDDEAGAAVPSA